jgi:prepilin-type N-terminal cleavage/methylation domain-containing protein
MRTVNKRIIPAVTTTFPARNRRCGFTLIELMIVCAIISLLAAFLIPSFIKARERARKARLQSTGEVAQRNLIHPPVDLSRRNEMAKAALPVFDLATMKMSLSAHHQRLGMDVYTRYEATYAGHFVVSRPDNGEEPVFLDFQFPLGTTEARDVSLTFSCDGKKGEPGGLVFDQKGIVWSGSLPGTGPVAVDVSFIAQGRDRFHYCIPPAGRIKSMEILIGRAGASSISLPDYGLQPTSMNDRELIWQFNNLVTDRAIIIELPGAQSPLGRTMLLSKLVGLAVLLFGAGFWYLAELYEAGRLNNFRLGHFLLLALTYSLFFIIFAVISFHGENTLYFNIYISAVLSLPLLILHVSRIIDTKFALTRTLPLALFTLGIVLVGVYGGASRDFIFIGATFVVIAFVTLTFRRWSSLRDAYVRQLEKNVAEIIEALGEKISEARRVDSRASEALAIKEIGHSSELRKELLERRKSLSELFKEFEGITLDGAQMVTIKDSGSREARRISLQDRALLLREKVSQMLQSIHSLLVSLDDSRKQAEITAKASPEGQIHCIACSASIERSPFCPQCGTAQPRVIICTKCGDPFSIPLHLVKKGAMDHPLFCLSCGEQQIVS